MLNRTLAPSFKPTQNISLPPIQSISGGGDLRIYSLANPNLEVFRLEIVFRAGSYFGEKFGLSFFASKLMPLGTVSKDAKQIAESFERFGGFLEVTQNQERLVITLHGLTKFFERYLEDLYAVIFEPIFLESELEIQKTIASQSYLVSMEKTAVEANKIFREGLFGETHSFGKTLNPAEIEIISAADLRSFHKKFIADASYNIFLTGNVGANEVDLLSRIFVSKVSHSSFLPILSPDIKTPFERIMDKKDSVQSSIRIGRRMFNRHHPDFFGFLVFNTIFGGYFGSRLMKNIREEKGLTYGISSSMVPLADEGYWSIGADVKKENVQLAISEIRKEIDFLKETPVTEDELSLVKNYMKGSVLNSTNTVFDMMDKHKAIIHENLPDNFYNSMLSKIDGVGVNEVQEMANKYMVDLSTVIVG
jgi:predicted Zn-dependent peptidase